VVVGKLALVLGAAAAACLLAAGNAVSDPAFAGQCGIRAQQTVWGEYGWPSLLPILAKPGTLLAVSQRGGYYASEARRRGAATYAFDLKLTKRVGGPAAPADPANIQTAAENEYRKAVSASGRCATPLIVENELFGAGTPTPWTASTAQYRANVLAYLQDLAAHGAHPALLVSKPPFTGSSDAVAWWLSVAKVADIIREVYPPATTIWPLGPIRGNRVLRQRYRQAVADFTSIGIPAHRLGIVLSFLSQIGGGGRNRMRPASAWYQVVKWEALSVKHVAREVGLGSVLSWGFQMWNHKEMDPDKPKAACVWVWARERRLCNAPRMLGRSFDRSLVEGQIRLARGAVCRVEGLGAVGAHGVGSLQALTGDRGAALSSLFERVVEAAARPVSRRAVFAAQRQVIRSSFQGRRTAYLAALRQAHATPGIALSVLGDEIRRARLEQSRAAPRPTRGAVAAFYAAYPDLLVRRVHVSPAPPWLGRRTGFAISESAPQRLFTLPAGRKSRIATLLGSFAVRPLGPTQPLGSLPLSKVRSGIVAALRGFERAQSFERWTIRQQTHALNRTICLHDQLPQPAAIDLTEYLPFLRIQ
jgi:hypothetical protein